MPGTTWSWTRCRSGPIAALQAPRRPSLRPTLGRVEPAQAASSQELLTTWFPRPQNGLRTRDRGASSGARPVPPRLTITIGDHSRTALEATQAGVRGVVATLLRILHSWRDSGPN